ncbi:uncharacterized protein LOC123304878 [Chrysoperla carnea]|uniref:uncharacterized protein LOC123304878 n=1 Tax=Chrysoperla carnea TaxID=189513 RepID=UPI001D05DA37|nr:uncharacterized protein LOC123304878 [Chrysoperla carnea]
MYGKLNNPHKLHKEIKSIWQEYVEHTFKDQTRHALLAENTTNSPYLPILLEEVEKAVEELGVRKACGEEGVFGEYLKCLDSSSIRELQNLCNEMYQTEDVPKILLESNFILLPKKINANECSDYRTITQVTTGCGNTKNIRIEKGVRQGCVLSPIFFNVYAEYIINEAIEKLDIGVKFNGVRVNNLRYADDTVLLSSSEVELQTLISKVAAVSEQHGLKLNIKKTSCMVFSKDPMQLNAGVQEEEKEQHGFLQLKDSQISPTFMN